MRRRIVRGEAFDLHAEAIFASLPLADEAIRAVEFALALETDLSIYPLVDVIGDIDVRAFKTRGTPTVPACVVLFTFDAETVTLVSIISADAENTQ